MKKLTLLITAGTFLAIAGSSAFAECPSPEHTVFKVNINEVLQGQNPSKFQTIQLHILPPGNKWQDRGFTWGIYVPNQVVGETVSFDKGTHTLNIPTKNFSNKKLVEAWYCTDADASVFLPLKHHQFINQSDRLNMIKGPSGEKEGGVNLTQDLPTPISPITGGPTTANFILSYEYTQKNEPFVSLLRGSNQ